MLQRLIRGRSCSSIKVCTVIFICLMLIMHLNQLFRSRHNDEYLSDSLNTYSAYSILLRSHTIWYNYLSKLKDSRSQQVYNLWMISYRPAKSSKNLRIKGLARYDLFDRLSYPNSSISTSDSFYGLSDIGFNCGKLFNISNQNDINLLVIGDCFPGFHTTTFMNIYKFYDRLISFVKSLIHNYPSAIVVWSLPIFPDNMNSELVLLHHHIITNVLIKNYALFIMQPYNLPTSLGEKQYIDHLLRQMIHIYCEISPHDFSVYNKYALNDKYLSIILSTVHKYLSKVRKDSSQNLNSQSLQDRCGKYIYTRKFDSFCMPRLKNVYPVLVTGLGGSGTHYITNELRSAGFKFFHEDVGEDGAVVSFKFTKIHNWSS